ncbi:hypothetical protein CPAR01_14277 [Colletotrichum paranaense]|uniref:Uncharacterized protein n=1 Tax=Colletotrichum paranaense TaxID=1914294 RepID=A0ABQ9S291_9PEZI|nr:uncharacterized protein CPAR01_14277 [Colletotrichum paranaense]KAK1522734.1 hypothetical protein CPAR01_14277 [Colletotrichum paranaense]
MADAKQGGDLYDMAKDGTKVPGDAGKQNIIKSVPNPHQQESAPGELGSTTLHGAADNALNTNEGRASGVGEGISATGHEIPQSVTGKPGGRGGTQGSEDVRAATGAFYTKGGRSKDDE